MQPRSLLPPLKLVLVDRGGPIELIAVDKVDVTDMNDHLTVIKAI